MGKVIRLHRQPQKHEKAFAADVGAAFDGTHYLLFRGNDVLVRLDKEEAKMILDCLSLAMEATE